MAVADAAIGERRALASRRNIISVSLGDHILFGEDDGRLATPEALRWRMDRWREQLGAGAIHWRVRHPQRIPGHTHAAKGRQHPFDGAFRDIRWDDLEVVPRLAHGCGLAAYLYVSLFDEGWPLPPKRVRERSYHNARHARHVSWQSAFSRRHPEFLVANQYGFNELVRRDYESLFGHDIRHHDFDLLAWRDLLGGYLTNFLAELREALGPLRKRLAVGAARGDVLGPPLGNATLQWRRWIEEGIVDDLVINQNSSRCPSLWIDLWPMHRWTARFRTHRARV